MTDDQDATGEGRKADPERSDSTGADESGVDRSGVDEAGSTESDEVTPGGEDVTADMVEAAEANALAEAGDADPDEAAETVDKSADRNDGALVGATAGSARAAARRQAVRTGKTAPKGAATAPRTGRQDRGNIFTRFARFLREVVSELRKVIWPTRKEMITYTVVVIVFVVFMVALVAGLDVLFAKGVLTVFG
jgi:preprotein translocase subunit SecE